jgi:hypothetical protein
MGHQTHNFEPAKGVVGDAGADLKIRLAQPAQAWVQRLQHALDRERAEHQEHGHSSAQGVRRRQEGFCDQAPRCAGHLGFSHAMAVTPAEMTGCKRALQALERTKGSSTKVQSLLADAGFVGEPFALGVHEILGQHVPVQPVKRRRTAQVCCDSQTVGGRAQLRLAGQEPAAVQQL